ncbi:MAG: MmcQ/YjbR family DNA-binding protein [Clostridia bacterium]|nr:MmcQ/YjbR family DNA-binding protein [Clostridia bacterium]
MNKGIFDYKSPNFNKLLAFGFNENGETYSYVTQIFNGQFEMRVKVSLVNGEVKTEVIDLSTGEPYTLHLVTEAGGTFVGSVRAEYERVLNEISEKCFEKDVFKGDCAHKVIEYVRKKYGDELEYLWSTFPSNAVWRRKDNKKWYGVMLLLPKRKLGFNSDEITNIIDLRIDPDVLPSLIDGKRYFAGYHMNKKNWITICLDGSVSVDEICARIDESYDLAKKG